MRLTQDVAFEGMAHAVDTARAIVRALLDARSAGRAPQVIILDEVTQESFERADLGYWSGGAGTWSLFNVAVMVAPMAGWWLQLAPEADTDENPGDGSS